MARSSALQAERSYEMVRLLMIEDDASAAEVTLRTLYSAGLPCACERVSSEVEFRVALSRAPDLILSDSNVAGFDGMQALRLAKSARPATPFIFVSGLMSEEARRRALDGGAADCVSKSDLTRLEAAVRSALRAATPSAAQESRRASDRSRRVATTLDAGDSAEYLLQRQDLLERALKRQAGSDLSSLLSRTPPMPLALVMIHSVAARDRYVKLLRTADIEVDVAADTSEALHKLATHIHALLFTDRLELIRHARQLSAGSATHIVHVSRGDEATVSAGLGAGANASMPVEARGEQFWAQLTIARRIVSFAASLQSAVTDNRLLSTIDELTRCGNRHFFEHQWPREVARAVRFARPLSLLICDIDHFKAINDQHGHPAGDQVLSEFGDRITRGLRLGEDWVARIGGEEFAIVLPETGRFEARAIAERLRESITAGVFLSSSLALPVTASFGVCGLEESLERGPDLPLRLVMAADAALYASKRSGRNRVTEAALHGTADAKVRLAP